MITDTKEIYEQALNTYGIESQMMMCIEEMAELTKELSKNYRGNDNRSQLAEEIADVKIMLAQMIMHFGVDAEVNEIIESKLFRLAHRLELV